MPLKQSFCLDCFRTEAQPLADLFREAKAIGFAAVEIWFWDEGVDAIAEEARRAGLVLCSMVGHGSHTQGLNDPTQHDRIVGELERSIRKAHELGVPGLITLSGNRHAGQSDEAGAIEAARCLRRVLPLAEELGVNLNLELLNSKVDHPFYMADRTDWAVLVCELCASPRAKILYDVYHMQLMEGDVIRTLREIAPLLGHLHTAGVPGRKDIDHTQELNYAAIGRALQEIGYDGYVGHEFWTRHEDRVRALREAHRILAGNGAD